VKKKEMNELSPHGCSSVNPSPYSYTYRGYASNPVMGSHLVSFLLLQ
jgi:hypothetical protein